MTGRLVALGLTVLVAAGCASSRAAAPSPARTGPPGVVRVGLAGLRWPLDPALAEGRDQTQLARTLYSTPFRVDAAGAVRPGLCSHPRSTDRRTWEFTCRHAAEIAVELGRVAALPAAPSHWLFADARRIEAGGDRLTVVLRHPRARFPLALTAVAAAPPDVPGPFRVVSATPERIVAARPGLRVVFTRVEPHAAAVAFRRGELDEAPVALGDIRAARFDPGLRGLVRLRPLLGVDLVVFDGVPPAVRRVYWQTADRATYQALVPEYAAPPAFGLTPGATDRGGAAAVRSARVRIRSLPHVAVRVAPGSYQTDLVVANWRDQHLDARVRATRPNAHFARILAPYPAVEALLGQVLSEAAIRPALAAADPGPLLARADEVLQRSARVVPLARVADARLVSPRLEGWRRDRLGSVDYAAVRALAASPRR